MRHAYLLAAASLCLFSLRGGAQATNSLFYEDSSIKVWQGGAQRQLAWCGGLNSPQFAQADLNNDGLKDLVVYEWGEQVIKTFINKGTATAASYVYAPEFARNFPPCYDYLKLEDYNRDGIADLFHKGSQGFAVYKGYYNSSNQLCFTFFKNLRYDSPFVGNVNVYTQASDIPGIADVDGDGDLDFFGYDVNGGLITFYKNCQVELGLPKDSIHICIPSNCWGHIFQGYGRPFTLGIVPSAGSPTCNTFGVFSCKMVDGVIQLKETKHQGNCMLVMDYDGDGDADMLDGNISFSDLQFLRNGKAQNGGTDSMVAQDTLWQSGGHAVNLPQWPAAFYVDADGDGKRDILVSPHDYSAGENYKSVLFYKNTGTAAAPQFSYQNDTFLIDKMVDAGTGSYPVLYDYNRDGKPDLFVGSEGYYQAGGSFRSKISYYENGSSSGATRLTWQTGDFNSLFARNYQGAAPAFGDIDGDGKDDMLIGHTDGTISYYKNTAVSNAVQPVWTLAQPLLKSVTGDTIDAGYYATPYIYDINKDGRPDLLIGSQTGRILYYQNNPAGGVPGLTRITDTLGGVRSVADNPLAGFSSLWIGKMDNTGTEYIVSGNGYGNIVRFSGFQTGNVTTSYARIDSFYSGIDAGQRSTVTIGDIDGDGKYEMIVGNRLGGLSLYKQGIRPVTPPPATGVSGAIATPGCMIYPNPASTEVVVTWDADFAGGTAVQVSLLNTVGQVVRHATLPALPNAMTIAIGDLPAGIYVCRVAAQGRQNAVRLTVIR